MIVTLFDIWGWQKIFFVRFANNILDHAFKFEIKFSNFEYLFHSGFKRIVMIGCRDLKSSIWNYFAHGSHTSYFFTNKTIHIILKFLENLFSFFIKHFEIVKRTEHHVLLAHNSVHLISDIFAQYFYQLVNSFVIVSFFWSIKSIQSFQLSKQGT